jgi:hypothetical protein
MTRAPPVPRSACVLAALGPRMLDLARDRTAGALPVLVTPEYTAQARARLGADALLVIQQLVILDADAARARAAARGPIGYLRDVEGGYRRHFRRMGFTEEDITQLSDRLVDALVVWGDLDTITNPADLRVPGGGSRPGCPDDAARRRQRRGGRSAARAVARTGRRGRTRSATGRIAAGGRIGQRANPWPPARDRPAAPSATARPAR